MTSAQVAELVEAVREANSYADRLARLGRRGEVALHGFTPEELVVLAGLIPGAGPLQGIGETEISWRLLTVRVGRVTLIAVGSAKETPGGS